MADFSFKVCGITASIHNASDSIKNYFTGFLTSEKALLDFYITPDDIAYERGKCIREAEVEGIEYVERSDGALELIAIQRKLTEALFERDTLLFHGSVIAVDGAAYLFTAKSGTGKSTHTRLWREMHGDRAIMVNDDKPFITVGDGGVTVHGSPWNGKHRLGENISLPLRAVCILERGETNLIKQIPASKAVTMLIQQSSRPKNPDLMPKYMELLDGLARGVRFYKLSCNMDPEAARVSYEEMARKD